MSTVEELLVVAEQLAKQHADGHITLLRFTTDHWKSFFGTVNTSLERERVRHAPKYPTLRAALYGLISSVGRVREDEESP